MGEKLESLLVDVDGILQRVLGKCESVEDHETVVKLRRELGHLQDKKRLMDLIDRFEAQVSKLEAQVEKFQNADYPAELYLKLAKDSLEKDFAKRAQVKQKA